jgi:hypothetical protein
MKNPCHLYVVSKRMANGTGCGPGDAAGYRPLRPDRLLPVSNSARGRECVRASTFTTASHRAPDESHQRARAKEPASSPSSIRKPTSGAARERFQLARDLRTALPASAVIRYAGPGDQILCAAGRTAGPCCVPSGEQERLNWADAIVIAVNALCVCGL